MISITYCALVDNRAIAVASFSAIRLSINSCSSAVKPERAASMVGRISAVSALHCNLAAASIMRHVVLSSTSERAHCPTSGI